MQSTTRRFTAGEASLRDRVGRLEGVHEMLLLALDDMNKARKEDRQLVLASLAEIKNTQAAHDKRIDDLATGIASHTGAAQATDKAVERRYTMRGIWIGAIGAVATVAIAVFTLWSVLK